MDMGGQAVPRGYYSNGSAFGSKEMLEASLEGFKPSGEDSNITRHGRLPPHQKNFAFIGCISVGGSSLVDTSNAERGDGPCGRGVVSLKELCKVEPFQGRERGGQALVALG
ncbi:hypothetical protein RRG08_065184 [Elysia crispata]|uniref:Uncharacterized protein n=1 Tax=Elysia crispata TaxID=231223 RepID=A0AAE0Z0B9_9GAST|nr:hypothetical protein RRG08_065184 [Elysia crispata]